MATPVTNNDPNSAVFGATTSPGVSQNPNSILGKDDFLKLLVAQIQYQDPLDGSSTDPTQSIQEMATFSELEQMTNISDSMSTLTFNNTLGSSTALIGKTVKYVDSQNGDKQGNVDHISVLNGQVMLNIDNGDQISLNQITEVDNPPAS